MTELQPKKFEGEPDIDEAIVSIRKAMEHAISDDPPHRMEIDLQRAAVALHKNPALIYPDYKDRNGPEHWYRCPENSDHTRVFVKSQDDWLCPICEL